MLRSHALEHERFPQWIRGDQDFGIGDRLVGAVEREQRVYSLTGGDRAQFLEPICHRLGPPLARPYPERRPAPHTECLVVERDRVERVRSAGAVEEAFEAGRVELDNRRCQRIADVGGNDREVSQLRPQTRHIGL